MVRINQTIRGKLMNGTSLPICPDCGETMKWVVDEYMCPFCDVHIC